MTKTRSAQPAQLLEAIRALGPGWVTRSQIAAHIGKPKLSPIEVTRLETLIQMGVIEAERHEIEGPIPLRWEYRIKG